MRSSRLPKANKTAAANPPAPASGNPARALKLQANAPKSAKIKFGTAIIDNQPLTEAELAQRLNLSQEALTRAKPELTAPGVRIYSRKNVPLFHADPENPKQFVRRLNGRTELGVLENGSFKVIM